MSSKIFQHRLKAFAAPALGLLLLVESDTNLFVQRVCLLPSTAVYFVAFVSTAVTV